jgi:hypothetical protein
MVTKTTYTAEAADQLERGVLVTKNKPAWRLVGKYSRRR